MLYTTNRYALDRVIEADTYRMSGKFFEFIKDREVVRSIKLDLVNEIRRMADDEEEEGDDEEEDDELQMNRARASADFTTGGPLASLPDPRHLDDLLASLPNAGDLDDLMAELNSRANLDELLAALPDLDESLRVLDTWR